MQINVHSILHIAQALGGSPVIVEVREGCTVIDLLREVDARTRQSGVELLAADGYTPSSSVAVSLNGRTVASSRALACELRDGDDILFLPPMGGG